MEPALFWIPAGVYPRGDGGGNDMHNGLPNGTNTEFLPEFILAKIGAGMAWTKMFLLPIASDKVFDL